jgi:hypothetical protein
MTWAEELDLPWGVVGRLGWPLVAPLAKAGLQASLRRLARLLAAGEHPRSTSGPALGTTTGGAPG